MSESKMGEVVILPGVELTPRVVLAKMLGEVDNIQAFAIVKVLKDGHITFSMTTGLDAGDLAVGALLLQDEVTSRFGRVEIAKPSTYGGDPA